MSIWKRFDLLASSFGIGVLILALLVLVRDCGYIGKPLLDLWSRDSVLFACSRVELLSEPNNRGREVLGIRLFEASLVRTADDIMHSDARTFVLFARNSYLRTAMYGSYWEQQARKDTALGYIKRDNRYSKIVIVEVNDDLVITNAIAEKVTHGALSVHPGDFHRSFAD